MNETMTYLHEQHDQTRTRPAALLLRCCPFVPYYRTNTCYAWPAYILTCTGNAQATNSLRVIKPALRSEGWRVQPCNDNTLGGKRQLNFK